MHFGPEDDAGVSTQHPPKANQPEALVPVESIPDRHAPWRAVPRATVGDVADEQIAKARKILARLCDRGLLSMSVPVRDDDEDMILSAVIDRAATPPNASLTPLAAPQAATACETCKQLAAALRALNAGVASTGEGAQS
jgi:hypothetical protein